jgi:hypothetical protein
VGLQAASLGERFVANTADELGGGTAFVLHVAADAASISIPLFTSGTSKLSIDDLIRL